MRQSVGTLNGFQYCWASPFGRHDMTSSRHFKFQGNDIDCWVLVTWCVVFLPIRPQEWSDKWSVAFWQFDFEQFNSLKHLSPRIWWTRTASARMLPSRSTFRPSRTATTCSCRMARGSPSCHTVPGVRPKEPGLRGDFWYQLQEEWHWWKVGGEIWRISGLVSWCFLWMFYN